ncbi:E3 ubiquitin-protein ligase rad18 [Pleurotus pulmonarius]|nr:E3 ubiquitin-protein ligase rad18 [Pleurotus pulmonarius]
MFSSHDNALKMAAEITDPFDLPGPSERPGLRDMDTSMRCTICQEFYDAPVTLSCGHCFCSLCIRNSLAEKPECPQCRKSSSDVHFRPNPAVEQAVEAWKAARPCILNLLKETADLLSRGNAGPAEGHSRSSTGSKPVKKRKRTRSVESVASIELVDPQSAIKSPEGEAVGCPICSKQVLYCNINTHMDSGCSKHVISKRSSQTTQATQWQGIFTGDNNLKGKQKSNDSEDSSAPLPKLAYGTMKEKGIRELLLKYSLSTHGDKAALVARHRQWVMMYNANLDKSEKNRKSLKELRKELKAWEDGSKSKKVVVEDTVAHERKYRSEFTDLVEKAKASSSAHKAPSVPISSPPLETTSDEVPDSEDEAPR